MAPKKLSAITLMLSIILIKIYHFLSQKSIDKQTALKLAIASFRAVCFKIADFLIYFHK